MSDITTFVDAICKNYEEKALGIEEDQNLPSRDVLEEVCQILLNVSCMREEGRFPSFRVCFIDPGSALLDTYIYAHTLRFERPVAFTARELHKLAPALNADMSYLVLDTGQRPFLAVGIIAAYTTWEKIMTREISSGTRMPMIPNILVYGPGELRACFGESSFVNYNAGRCVFFRTDTFTSTLIADRLRADSLVPDHERLQLLYRILWQMTGYGHGGTVLITPSAKACREYVDIKYQMPSRYLFGDEETYGNAFGRSRYKEIITYADLIAKLTAVDGSVVLTRDFDLLGFGAETLMDRMDMRQPEMCFIGHDDHVDENMSFKDFGMRHRAAYRFCSAVKGSAAFVISQDGSIEACTEHKGKVFVYDNVALPYL